MNTTTVKDKSGLKMVPAHKSNNNTQSDQVSMGFIGTSLI